MEEEITNIKLNMVEFRKDIDHIKEKQEKYNESNEKGHDEIKSLIKGNMNEVKALFANTEKRFAKKWVETFLLWVGGIIGTALIVGIITLLVRAFLHLNS